MEYVMLVTVYTPSTAQTRAWHEPNRPIHIASSTAHRLTPPGVTLSNNSGRRMCNPQVQMNLQTRPAHRQAIPPNSSSADAQSVGVGFFLAPSSVGAAFSKVIFSASSRMDCSSTVELCQQKGGAVREAVRCDCGFSVAHVDWARQGMHLEEG